MGLHIVLFEPRDYNNVGNIGRSCAAFNAKLHLIRPFGDKFTHSNLKKSSAGHWDEIEKYEYLDIEDFFEKINPNKNNEHYMFTRFGLNQPSSFNYDLKEKEIYLWFGREDIGLPIDLLQDFKKTTIRIPTSSLMRSINLSNSVAIALFNVVEQNNFDGMCIEEPHKDNPLK